MVLCPEEAIDLPNTLLVLALLVNEKIFKPSCRLSFMTCEFVHLIVEVDKQFFYVERPQ